MVKSQHLTKSLYVQGLGEKRPFSCSSGDDQLQELGSVSIGGRPILTFLKGVVGQANGYPLWVWEVHMHSLKARWDPANLFGFTASWQWDWILLEESQREQKAWPGVLAQGVSSSFHVWSVWAKTGQDRPSPSQFTSWFSARDYNVFQGKTLHLSLVFLRCVCACLLLVLRVCVHQKELAKAFSFSHFACLTLTLCSPEASATRSLQSPSCMMISPEWFPWAFLCQQPGMFLSFLGKVLLVLVNSEVKRICKNRGTCFKSPPIITSHEDWRGG